MILHGTKIENNGVLTHLSLSSCDRTLVNGKSEKGPEVIVYFLGG
jgi:hypothetical protein